MGLMDRFKKAINEGLDSSNAKTVHKSVKIMRNATGSPRVSLDKISAAGGVDLTKAAQAAGVSLSKAGLQGIRGKAVLVLDHSGSMNHDYANGSVQKLVEKALGYGLQFASDEQVTVIPFDGQAKAAVSANLDNFHDIVNEKIYNPHTMGTTNLTAAFERVKTLVRESSELVYCMVVTDGNPNDTSSCTKIVCELSGYPVFIKFLALGGEISYLQQLDDLDDSYRLLDNVDAKFYPSIDGITDQQFADDMADEWASWIDLATAAGVLTK